jgi:hypothetical protein
MKDCLRRGDVVLVTLFFDDETPSQFSSVVVSCVVVVVLLQLSWWLLVARAGVGVAVAPGVNLTPDATAASALHLVWMCWRRRHCGHL